MKGGKGGGNDDVKGGKGGKAINLSKWKRNPFPFIKVYLNILLAKLRDKEKL